MNAVKTTTAAGYKISAFSSGLGSDESRLKYLEKQYKLLGINWNKVAERFPWIRQVSSWITTGQQLTVAKLRDPAFVNNSPYPIPIHEVRFYLGNQYERGAENVYTGIQDIGTTPPNYSSLQKAIWTKMSIPDRRQIIERWAPIHLLNTEETPVALREADSFAVKLPAPYFLARERSFMMDIAWDTALESATSNPGYVTLYGKGVHDGEPITLIKNIPSMVNGAAGQTPFITIAFDDDQGVAMRDAVITHIGFGAKNVTNANWILQNIQFRPHAPQGPAWHQGEFFRVAHLATQGSALFHAAPYFRPATVIHRPVVPYILKPGEAFTVDLFNRTNEFPGSREQNFWVDVILIGTQEEHNE